MIDEGILTRALQAIIVAANLSATVERGTRINFDPGRCPWMGIYPGTVDSRPKTLGGSARWANIATPQIVLQTASYDSDGQAASDELETLIASVLSVIDADLTLGITGARVVAISREYRYVVFDGDESGNLFMPQVVIKLQMEVRSA
jgi:hypothetical protein